MVDDLLGSFRWYDALCINQEDVEERSLQVLRMTSIYRTAFRVVAWIGSATAGQANLRDYLDRTTTLLQESDPGIGHFHDLLSRKYWRRMWIIQEISVATDIWVVCGSSWVNWDTLCGVFNLYETREKDRHNAISSTQGSMSASQIPWATPSADNDHHMSTNRVGIQSTAQWIEDELVKAYEGLKTFRDFRSLVANRTPLGFLEALKKTSAFLATDDRDKIYAFLGLVYDGRSFVPTPDYRIVFNDLKVQMVVNVLHTTKNLDVILACGHEQILDGRMPS